MARHIRPPVSLTGSRIRLSADGPRKPPERHGPYGIRAMRLSRRSI